LNIADDYVLVLKKEIEDLKQKIPLVNAQEIDNFDQFKGVQWMTG